LNPALPIFLSVALFGAQLDPKLMPHKAPRPVLPKIDYNACPFEGCQFGKWTARRRVVIYQTRAVRGRPVATLQKGEEVTALTGVNVTYEPSEFRVTAPIPDYGLKPGDTILGYMYLGEGAFNAWFKGNWVETFDDGPSIEYGPFGSGCRPNCNARLLKPGRFEWWAEIKTKSGIVGWTKESNAFDGADALAGH
jgi:hypothetical protein